MRILFTTKMRQGEELVEVDAVLWVGETPPSCRRGKTRKMKSRKYKRQQQALIVERHLESRSQLERLIQYY